MKSKIFLLFSVMWFAQITKSQQVTTDINEEGEAFYEIVNKINNTNLPSHASTEWFKEMQKPTPNVLYALTEYNKFIDKYPFYHSKNRRLFETWLQTVSMYLSPEGNINTASTQQKNSNKISSVFKSAIFPPSSEYVGTWRMIGTNKLDPLQGPCNNNAIVTGGFVDRAYINPYNTNNMIAGMSYGGLWTTTNGGSNWALTDANFSNGTNTYANRDYYYGDIKANKINSNLIYTATEAGLLKSIDGGMVWTLCPNLNRTDNTGLRPYYVAQATNNQTTVLCTFGRKLYRSTDAGTNWVLVFDNSAGGSNHNYTSQYNFTTPFGLQERTYNFFGIQEDYNDPNHFYAGVWNASNQACIYHSSNGGLTWSLLTNLNIYLGTSWNANTSLILKTILGSAAKFFVVPQFTNPSTYYRFSNTGILASSNAINYEAEAFDIDWQNENIVYVSHYSSGYTAADYVKKSLDGGVTIINPTTGCGYLHPDMRGISAVGNKVLLANDAGLGFSDDGCANIRGTGFEISSPDIWGFSSSTRGDRLLAGLDHNQTFVRTFDGNAGWKNIKGADAGACKINTGNDHWLYYDWAYGVNKAFIDDLGTVTEYSSAAGINYSNIKFHSYYLFNLFAPSGTQIKKSNDNLSSLTVLFDFGAGQNVTQFATTSRDPKTMYAVINFTTLYKTIDAGISWINITPTLLQSSNQTNITALETGKTPGEIWISYGNFQTACKVMYSTTGGSSWTNITSSGLPVEPINEIAYQRGTEGCVYVFINTLSGGQLWYKTNAMAAWAQVGNNLAAMGYLRDKPVPVPQKGVIRLGSSRGIWENPLPITSKPEALFSVEDYKVNCATQTVKFHDASAYKSGTTTLLWSFPGGTPSTSSSPDPQINYMGAAGTYPVTLKVTDANGDFDEYTANNVIVVAPNICKIDSMAGYAISPVNQVVPLTVASINSNTFTVSFWTKPNGLQKVFSQLIATEAPNTRFGIGISFPGYIDNLNLTFTHPDVGYGLQTSINLVNNEWNHITLTYSPTGVSIYLNGNTPWNYPITNARVMDFSQAVMSLNRDIHGQGGNYNGEIDEIKMYNRVLSQNEIRENMNLIFPAGEPNLKLYYQFNQYDPAKGFLYDASGNGSTSLPNSAIIVSSAPVATGVSSRLNVNSPTNYSFVGTNMELGFSGSSTTIPNGDVVVSKLYSKPFNAPTGYNAMHPNYWIVKNYGANANFNAAVVKINNVSISAADAASPSLLKITKRPSNSFLNTEWLAGCGANSATAGDFGNVTFNTGCNINSFSQFVLGTNGTSVLPLRFLLFSAYSVTANKIKLVWQTENEWNNARFIIEKSNDGFTWKVIGSIKSYGNGNFDYQYIDDTPFNGKNYYRLKQVDNNGQFTFSEIRIVELKTAENISIFPNPFSNDLLIQGCTGPTNDLQLYSIDGKKVASKAVRQFDNSIKLETKGLPIGTYILMIKDRGFKITKTQ